MKPAQVEAPRLRSAMEAAGLDAVGLGKMVGCDRKQVYHWTQGIWQVPRHRLPNVCRALGITMEWLMTGEDLRAAPAEEPVLETDDELCSGCDEPYYEGDVAGTCGRCGVVREVA